MAPCIANNVGESTPDIQGAFFSVVGEGHVDDHGAELMAVICEASQIPIDTSEASALPRGGARLPSEAGLQ